MDSINKQQPEKNHENLSGQEAIDRVIGLVRQIESCFFCTENPVRGSRAARPMTVREVDENGHIWFLSSEDSHKNTELDRDESVTLYFQGSSHSDFLVLDGTAKVSKDKATIERLWDPTLKTWFTGGIDDPRITAIEVTPRDGYYWDTKHGNLVAGLKILIGAATGKTLDDSIEGRLKIPA